MCSWIHQCSERLLTCTWMLKVLLLKKGKLVVKFCFQASGIPVFTISVESIRGQGKPLKKCFLRNTVLLNHDSSSWMMAMDTSSLPGRFRDWIYQHTIPSSGPTWCIRSHFPLFSSRSAGVKSLYLLAGQWTHVHNQRSDESGIRLLSEEVGTVVHGGQVCSVSWDVWRWFRCRCYRLLLSLCCNTSSHVMFKPLTVCRRSFTNKRLKFKVQLFWERHRMCFQ